LEDGETYVAEGGVGMLVDGDVLADEDMLTAGLMDGRREEEGHESIRGICILKLRFVRFGRLLKLEMGLN
jgi:hypothetical protein